LPPNNLIAFALYLVVSLSLAGVPVLTHPMSMHVGLGEDPSVMMWCMVWWPYAITHHLNPFVSKLIWAPTGSNLTWTTSIPAIALVLAPITWIFGPIVSYNVGALLAPAVSAWSAFALCRWLTGNLAASIIGGLLYGFSPYEVGHILAGHLSLTANFVLPLCLLWFGRLLDRSITSLSFVLSFSALLVIQCLISNEVFATMTSFGILAWISAYAILSGQRRIALRATLLPLTAAFLAAAVILLPFFYFALANRAVPRYPLFPPVLFSADLLEFVVPTPLLLLASHSVEAVASRAFGNIQENEFYLGLPVLLLVGYFFWIHRSEPLARILAVMLLLVATAAVGPVLHIADHAITRVPWAALFELPLLKQALPVRFANYGFILLALIVSLSLAKPKRFTNILVAFGIAALAPDPALLLWPERYQQPAFFSTSLYRRVLHRDENIVVFPYGVRGPSMLWQAQTGMYFSMSGAWMGPTPDEFQRWPAVNAALAGLPLPAPGAQLRSFLAAHRVEAVVVADGADSHVAALGITAIRLGGVSIYPMPRSTAPIVSDRAIDQLEQSATQQWFADLLEAAGCYLDAGGELSKLNPVNLQKIGLLPEARWVSRLDLVLGGAPHGGAAELWVGPGPTHTAAFGLFASPSAVRSIIERYGPEATSIYYPYPSRFTGVLPADHRIDFLLITLPVDFVRRTEQAETASSDLP
jgi:hypothetical protein